MLCDHLEGRDREGEREGNARGKRYGDICICIADSLCYKAETNNIVKQLYSNKKLIIKKRKFCMQVLYLNSFVFVCFIYLETFYNCRVKYFNVL